LLPEKEIDDNNEITGQREAIFAAKGGFLK
jgi:hypothetical protein